MANADNLSVVIVLHKKVLMLIRVEKLRSVSAAVIGVVIRIFISFTTLENVEQTQTNKTPEFSNANSCTKLFPWCTFLNFLTKWK